jgi:hypothetical protein
VTRFGFTLALVSVVVVAGGTAAVARPGVSRSDPSRFCQAAALFGKSSISSSLATLPPATLKSDYTKFKSAQPAMLSEAPHSIKGDLGKIFSFDDGIFVDLSKSGWSVVKLSKSDLETLAVNGPKLKPAGDAVTAYLDKTCGLKLPLP